MAYTMFKKPQVFSGSVRVVETRWAVKNTCARGVDAQRKRYMLGVLHRGQRIVQQPPCTRVLHVRRFALQKTVFSVRAER